MGVLRVALGLVIMRSISRRSFRSICVDDEKEVLSGVVVVHVQSSLRFNSKKILPKKRINLHSHTILLTLPQLS